MAISNTIHPLSGIASALRASQRQRKSIGESKQRKDNLGGEPLEPSFADRGDKLSQQTVDPVSCDIGFGFHLTQPK